MNEKKSKTYFIQATAIALVIALSLQIVPQHAFAVDEIEEENIASESATFVDASMPSLSQFISDGQATISALLLSSDDNQPSAKIRQKAHVRKLKKKHYRANEKVDLIIDNAQELEVSVKDKSGKKLAADIAITSVDDAKIVRILPPRQLQPGVYTVTVQTSGETVTQDFTWGVLAMNTNKAVFSPNELVHFAIAVLDQDGYMVCDAGVSLVITDPQGNKQELTTKNKDVHITDQCAQKIYSLTPDYEATYETSILGVYETILTAKTTNGTFTISDSFSVREQTPFVIERIATTRLFPPVKYPVQLSIIAQEDFQGFITETVPEGFVIDKPTDGTKPFDSIKVVAASDESRAKSVEDLVLGESTVKLAMPFSGYFPLTQGFGAKLTDGLLKKRYALYGLDGHDGADFALPKGVSVLAVDDAEVILAREKSIYGTTVVLEHSWGKSYYGHLSKLKAKEDTKVKRGEVLGLSGNTGLSTGPHLHFGMKLNVFDINDGYFGKINPLPYLGIEESAYVRDTVQVLAWKVAMKKGDTMKLGYSFTSPNISPQFYTLGPLKFFKKNASALLDINEDSIASSSGSEKAPILSREDEEATASAGILHKEEDDHNNSSEHTFYYKEERIWQLAIDAQTAIDSAVSVKSENHVNTGRNIVFTDNQNGYVFYVDDDGVCKYAKTTDGGVTWTSPLSVDSTNQTDCLNPIAWYDQWTPGDDTGTRIHIVFKDSGNDDIWYRVLNTSDDTFGANAVAITSSPGPALTNTFTHTKNRLTLTKTQNGQIYVGVHDNSNSYIISCELVCTTPSAWSNISPTMLSAANADLLLMPLVSNNVMAIRQRPGKDDIEFAIYTRSSTSWSPWADIETNYGGEHPSYKAYIAATVEKGSNAVYLVYRSDTATLGADDDIRTAVFNGTSWASRTDPVHNSNDGIRNNLGIIAQTITIDQNTGAIYILYAARTNPAQIGSANVYYRKSNDGMQTWEEPSAAINNPLVSLMGISVNMLSSDRIYASWHDNDGVGSEALFGDSVADLTGVIPAEKILRHGRYSTIDGELHPFIF